MSLSEQCAAIASLPNDSCAKTNRYDQRFSVSKIGKPCSVRNSLLWSFTLPERRQQFVASVHKLLEDDKLIATQKEKKIKAKAKTRTMTLQHLKDNIGEMEIAPNMSSNLSIFSNFTTELVHNGVIHWRHHSEIKDTFVMNDYHTETGVFLPNEHIHCSKVVVETGFEYVCNCGIFRMLIEQSEIEGLALNVNEVTCLHCRLLKSMNLKDIGPCTTDFSALETKFLSAQCTIGQPLVILRTMNSTKFSVLLNDSCTFVTLTQHSVTKKHALSCNKGQCSIKGARQTLPLSPEGLCPHLAVMRDNFNIWKDLLPDVDVAADVQAQAAAEIDEFAPALDNIEQLEPQKVNRQKHWVVYCHLTIFLGVVWSKWTRVVIACGVWYLQLLLKWYSWYFVLSTLGKACTCSTGHIAVTFHTKVFG